MKKQMVVSKIRLATARLGLEAEKMLTRRSDELVRRECHFCPFQAGTPNSHHRVHIYAFGGVTGS